MRKALLPACLSFAGVHDRVCVVNNAGVVLLDSHVAQRERVTDFRTRFSGVRPSDLVGAPPLEQVAAQVAAMFKGRTIVGHAITNDLTVRYIPSLQHHTVGSAWLRCCGAGVGGPAIRGFVG